MASRPERESGYIERRSLPAGQTAPEDTPQILHSKYRCTLKRWLLIRKIKLRLGENCAHRIIEEFTADSLNIVTVEKPHGFEILYPKQRTGIIQQRSGFVVQPLLFFNINSIDHLKPLLPPALSHRCHGGRICFQSEPDPQFHKHHGLHPAVFQQQPYSRRRVRRL